MTAKGIFRQILVLSTSALVACGSASACGGTSCDCNTLVQAITQITAAEAQDADAGSALYTHLQMLGDQDFMRQAMENSAAKIVLGQLVLKNSQRNDLRQFAQRLMQDQIELSQQVLERVGRPLGVEEQRDLTKKDKQVVARLAALSGAQFDDEFIKTLLKDQKQDMKRFGDEMQLAMDSRVKIAAGYNKNLASQHIESLQRIADAPSLVAENHTAGEGNSAAH